jgi:hypothetical protein
MKITTIKAMRHFLYENSGFCKNTINNIILALGYSLNGNTDYFIELSSEFESYALHGVNTGFGKFCYLQETIAFFKRNQTDIVNHLENTSDELGIDFFSMVQGFGVFRNSKKPTINQIGRALWGNRKIQPELCALYNVFAWYALEEVARTWLRYLEENPIYRTALSA